MPTSSPHQEPGRIQRRRATGWTAGRILATRLGTAVAIALIFVSSHPTESHGLKDILLTAVGLAMVLISIKGRLWCILYIGGKKDKQLVTDGPYALCRNPLYFYSALGVTGIAAASGMLSAVLILIAIFLLAYEFVIRTEEKKLLRLHGEAFEQYCLDVPRFWPLGNTLEEPDRHEFSPRLFHRTFWDATGFLAGWMAVSGVHALHALNLLPKWLQIY